MTNDQAVYGREKGKQKKLEDERPLATREKRMTRKTPISYECSFMTEEAKSRFMLLSTYVVAKL